MQVAGTVASGASYPQRPTTASSPFSPIKKADLEPVLRVEGGPPIHPDSMRQVRTTEPLLTGVADPPLLTDVADPRTKAAEARGLRGAAEPATALAFSGLEDRSQ